MTSMRIHTQFALTPGDGVRMQRLTVLLAL